MIKTVNDFIKQASKYLSLIDDYFVDEDIVVSDRLKKLTEGVCNDVFYEFFG